MAAAMAALRFDEPSTAALQRLSDAEWIECLEFCDQARLTLLLGEHAPDALPEAVRERIDRNGQSNEVRLRRLETDYLQIASQLSGAALEHVLLKGFAQEPDFSAKRGLRPQYDLDLLLRRTNVVRASDIIADLGYRQAAGQRTSNVDHLPAMVRPTGWRWVGNYFDAEIPTMVELHFRLWDEETERLAAPGLNEFWDRRTERDLADATIPVFERVDQLGYGALHVLRHLLRGDVKPFHVYELGFFLQQRRDDWAFWNGWRRIHEPELRALECVPLLLARRWFGCELPAAVKEDVAELPPEVERWLERFAVSPLTAGVRPNKDELWLHLSLGRRMGDKARILARRLVPLKMPGPVDGVFVPEEAQSARMRLERWARWWEHLGGRLRFHLQSYQALVSGARRWWRQ
jgi:hypothetical protein